MLLVTIPFLGKSYHLWSTISIPSCPGLSSTLNQVLSVPHESNHRRKTLNPKENAFIATSLKVIKDETLVTNFTSFLTTTKSFVRDLTPAQ